MPRIRPQTADEKERYRTGQKNAKGKIICGAKKRNGDPCPVTTVMLNGRCRMHGGGTPAGVASPHYKGRGYSRYLKGGLLTKFDEAVKDGELLSMRDDVALVNARIAQVLESLDLGENSARWLALRAAHEELKRARAMSESVERAQALARAISRIGELIDAGAQEAESWIEILNLMESRRRLSESERKRLVDMQQMMTAEEAMLFMHTVADIIRQHVTDSETLQVISRELIKLTVQRPSGTVIPSPGD